MGVTGGSLDLGVSEQFSDHGQTLADQQPAAGETVPQVMNSYIVEPGARADTPPGMLHVSKMTSRFAPRDYPRVAVTPVDALKDGDRRIAEIHYLGARLVILATAIYPLAIRYQAPYRYLERASQGALKRIPAHSKGQKQYGLSY